MDFDRAKDIIQEMARCHVTGISFTAGEFDRHVTGISFTAGEFDRQRVFTDYRPNVCSMNPYLSPELDMQIIRRFKGLNERKK
jgi:hypothetical protein